MDAQVDNHLGDTISVTLLDGTQRTLLGFARINGSGMGAEGMDPIQILRHVKIDKTPDNIAALPDGPASIKRLTTARFPGLYKPAADSIDDDGAAWIFDVQKARPL